MVEEEEGEEEEQEQYGGEWREVKSEDEDDDSRHSRLDTRKESFLNSGLNFARRMSMKITGTAGEQEEDWYGNQAFEMSETRGINCKLCGSRIYFWKYWVESSAWNSYLYFGGALLTESSGGCLAQWAR